MAVVTDFFVPQYCLSRYEKAKQLSESEARAAGVEMIHSEGLDRYLTWDELGDLSASDLVKLKSSVVWGTYAKDMHLSAEWIVDNACEDLHEGAYDSIDEAAKKELQEYLDGWCKRHARNARSYEIDYKTVILIEEGE